MAAAPSVPMPSWFPMYQVREAQEKAIDEAFDKDDYDKVDELCSQALDDPRLPALLRAKCEVLICFGKGRDPVLHIGRAKVMFERVQQFIDVGDASERTIQLLAALRDIADDIMNNLKEVEVPVTAEEGARSKR